VLNGAGVQQAVILSEVDRDAINAVEGSAVKMAGLRCSPEPAL